MPIRRSPRMEQYGLAIIRQLLFTVQLNSDQS
jgi:hypothetical protein